MKKVLLVSYAYPPISSPGALRMANLVRELPAFGWEPSVVTSFDGYSLRIGGLADPLSNDDRRVWRIKDPLAAAAPDKGPSKAAAAAQGGTLLGRVKRMAKSLATPLLQPDRAVVWNLRARGPAVERARKFGPFDLVYSTSPLASNHLLGRRVARRLGIPWVAEFRDPMSIGADEANASRAKRAAGDIERKVVEGADGVVCLTHGMASYFKRRYPARASRIVEAMSGVDAAKTQAQPRRPPGETVVLLHAGSLYGGSRDTDTIMAGAAAAKADVLSRHQKELSIQFIGEDSHFADAAVDRHGASAFVQHLGRMPYDETLKRMSNASANVILMHSDELSSITIPSKYFDSVQSGRPVLAFGPPGTDMERVVTEDKSGSFVNLGDVEGAKAAILKLAAGELEWDDQFSRDLLNRHSYAQTAAKISKLFEAITVSKG